MQSARRALCHGNSGPGGASLALRALHEMAYRIESAPKPGDRHVPISHDDEQILSFVNSGDLVNPNPRGSTPTNRSVQVSVG